jgi:hypothetical protein
MSGLHREQLLTHKYKLYTYSKPMIDTTYFAVLSFD